MQLNEIFLLGTRQKSHWPDQPNALYILTFVGYIQLIKNTKKFS